MWESAEKPETQKLWRKETALTCGPAIKRALMAEGLRPEGGTVQVMPE